MKIASEDAHKIGVPREHAAAAFAGCSPSVTAAVRVGCPGGSDPDRHHVHETVATEQKITVLASSK
jgi:hypothetical protein